MLCDDGGRGFHRGFRNRRCTLSGDLKVLKISEPRGLQNHRDLVADKSLKYKNLTFRTPQFKNFKLPRPQSLQLRSEQKE